MKLHHIKPLRENSFGDENEDFTTDEKAIRYWCNGFGIDIKGNTAIDNNGAVEVTNGSVTLKKFVMNRMPFRISRFIGPLNSLMGNVVIADSLIETLEGFPAEISTLSISNCKELKSLRNGPSKVRNLLITKASPGFDFSYLPEISGQLRIADCKIKSLEDLQLPVRVHGMLDVSSNKLTNLKGIPQGIAGHVDVSYNKIKSLVGIHELIVIMDGGFACNFEHVVRGGIGLMLIPGLKSLNYAGAELPAAFAIIKKYLQKPEEIYDCQMELIEAGFEAYAEL